MDYANNYLPTHLQLAITKLGFRVIWRIIQIGEGVFYTRRLTLSSACVAVNSFAISLISAHMSKQSSWRAAV